MQDMDTLRAKIRAFWHLSDSQQLKVEVSSKKLAGFVVKACSDLGLESEGPMPFTEKAIDWSQYMGEEKDSRPFHVSHALRQRLARQHKETEP
jgi:hypothetical protein